MTQPPDSSGGGFGDPSPEEHQAPPPSPWGTAPPAGQVPPPGYYPPPGIYGQMPPPPGQYQQPGYQQPGYQQPGYQQPGYQGAPPPYRGQPAFALSPEQERTWAMFAHISSIIAGFFLGMSFLGPLIVMLTQGTRSAFVRRHAVESLNFQLTLLIALIAGSVLSVVLLIATLGLALLVLIPVGVAAFIAALVITVLGAVKANNGEDYRYPVNIRMVK